MQWWWDYTVMMWVRCWIYGCRNCWVRDRNVWWLLLLVRNYFGIIVLWVHICLCVYWCNLKSPIWRGQSLVCIFCVCCKYFLYRKVPVMVDIHCSVVIFIFAYMVIVGFVVFKRFWFREAADIMDIFIVGLCKYVFHNTHAHI